MMIHSVYFWLKPELSIPQIEKFRKGLDSLGAISSVDKIYIGAPAATPRRPLIDSSYSYALVLIFKDLAAHDAYQIDPIHVAFNDSCRELWARVQIYDAT
jgi:Stress responsive A/B Barrel Domain